MIGAIFTRRAVKSAFEALNEGNVDKMLSHWNADCTFFYPGKVNAGGLYTGKSALRKWLEDFFIQFPQRKYTIRYIGIENILDLVGNNTVLVYFDLDLTNKEGMQTTNSGVSVITIKRAKAVKEEILLKVIDGDEYRKSWGDIT